MGDAAVVTLTLDSPDFADGAAIPRRHAGRGEGDDIAPTLVWSEPPAGTHAFVLAVDDPDAPKAKPYVHWLVADIPADVRALRPGDGALFVEGRTDVGRTGWTGPLPPRGHGVHHYRFRLYALTERTRLPPAFDVDALTVAIDGRVLAVGQLTGTYERR